VFQMVREGFRLLEGGELSPSHKQTVRYLLHRNLRLADAELGLLPAAAPPLPRADTGTEAGWAEELLPIREAARRRREYATADAIRDLLAGHGYQLEDTPEGPRLRRPRLQAGDRHD
jgi:cysteinyl-tRNA synthetase